VGEPPKLLWCDILKTDGKERAAYERYCDQLRERKKTVAGVGMKCTVFFKDYKFSFLK
jgi:hypothetical protein